MILAICPSNTLWNTYRLYQLILKAWCSRPVLTKVDLDPDGVGEQVNGTAPGSIRLNPHDFVAVMNGTILFLTLEDRNKIYTKPSNFTYLEFELITFATLTALS